MNWVLISGALANKPGNGGNAWSRLSWVQGFRRLGFEVCFVEQISRVSCVDVAGRSTPFHDSANVAFFRETMDRFDLTPSSALICEESGEVHGLPLAELASRARQACLLFNLSGHLTLPELKRAPACKVYYDDDPGFTQFWHAAEIEQERSAGILPPAPQKVETRGTCASTSDRTEPLRPGVPRSGAASGGARLEGHDFFFTLGANIGAPDCVIPTGGLAWRHTRPPVVLEDWPDLTSSKSKVQSSKFGQVHETPFDRFTTIASWRGAYGTVQHGGRTYGLKVHEFRKFFELPQRTGLPFEIALQIHPADQKDLDALRAHGWRIVDPQRVVASTDSFRRYVQSSGAEFSVAQGIYVDTNSGWFSDRTVRYLASGRPALVQETGFSRHLPTGEGLLAFRSMEEAMDGVGRLVRDYERHCRAARRVAEEFFDSDKVIRRLIEEIGLKAP